jgi:hypothetical protein
MGLGLLRAVSTPWPDTRGCWHDGLFYVAGSSTEGRITEFLAKEWQPTPY